MKSHKLTDKKNHRGGQLSKGAMQYSILLMAIITANNAFSQPYEVPPSSSTSSHVPYISDQAMEQCVISYNEAKWLSDEIKRTQVNQYDQASITSYNDKVTRHASMIDAFNRDCAGKQSESAYKAAQELNRRGKGG